MKILITGASRGIGFQITKDLLVEKNKLILQCNKNQKKIKKYLKENNYKAVVVQTDLSSPNGVEGLFNKTIEKIGFPDAIVNNAGIAESAYVEEPFFNWSEMFDKTISVNLKAPALICKEFIYKKRKEKIQNRLRIINISSRAAFRGEEEDFISYACSKGGLISLTKTITRAFGKKDNVLAFSIAPGFVNTEMAKDFITQHGEDHAKKGIVLNKLTEPKDVSSIVSFIVSGKMDHSTGSTIDVNAGSYLR